MAHRKLQQEVERVFKKINEGLETFDMLHERHQNLEIAAQRDKIESDLKREVKKLQKLREQVKVWQTSNDVKDKDALLLHRRRVEVAMEQYKAIEKGSKTKAYSNTSLRNGGELDPEEREKMEAIQFVQDAIDDLERQFQVAEVDIEKLNAKKGKRAASSAAEKEELKELQGRYRWHQQQLELALRLVENGELDYNELASVKEELEYFLQHNRDIDFVENEYIYESLDLESNAVLQKEISEGFASVDETLQHQHQPPHSSHQSTSLPQHNEQQQQQQQQQQQPQPQLQTLHTASPAKTSREATPLSTGSITQSTTLTPKTKKILTLASNTPSPLASTLRPARAPPVELAWNALAAGVDAEKERKEKEEKERVEREEKERLERELREKEEERERLEKLERERLEKQKLERETNALEEKRRAVKEQELKRRAQEKAEREKEERDREERERQRELKRELRFQSLVNSSKTDEPQQIIITGSSPALLKHLEEKKRLEEEEEKRRRAAEEAELENGGIGPLDESAFRNDSELLLLPPGLQDIVSSYYASRRTNDKVVTSVAQSLRPPREYLPANCVPSMAATAELNRALNIWSLVRLQLANVGRAQSVTSSAPHSSVASPSASPSPQPALPASVASILSSLDNGTLFYAFYYALTPYETNAAEQELVKRQWRADSDKKWWFQRLSSAPLKQGKDFEVASYKKFDAELWSVQELVNYKLDYSILAV